ncbi:PH domain-containing protein [Promicromonospora sp. Populi]|uniref:PH domain-containing protein n=1 Tax=Promicromonospora sp. Populi TaxID=3239420 RepID=UPI0034E1FBE6
MSATADFVIRNRAMQRYILANEKIVIATHRHWAKLWEPILTTSGAFVLAVALLVAVDPDVRDGLAWVWLPFLVLGARLLYKWLDWRAEWFVMTDRRLMLLTGFLVHRVAMMPSEKVTDLGYERTPLGQILGYGTFIFETAGQDQALDRVTWIPRPDSRYRLIIATLFHPDVADAEAAAQANPGIQPQPVPVAEPPTVTPPPALMPRIGRRSNPPTQRIEVPIARSGAPGGGSSAGNSAGRPVSGSANNAENNAASGAVGGSTAQDAPQEGEDAPGVHWSPTGAAASVASPGTASGAAPGATGGLTSADRARADYARAERARTDHARTERARDSADSGHVPGGPTADLDTAEQLPSPFIEGGKDPKIR